jgi:hypothetical protein
MGILKGMENFLNRAGVIWFENFHCKGGQCGLFKKKKGYVKKADRDISINPICAMCRRYMGIRKDCFVDAKGLNKK